VKKFKIYSTVIIFLIGLASCSGENLDGDAKKAAELTRISLKSTLDKNWKKAGNEYSEVQKIINKYKEKGQIKEFYEAYNSYLEEPGS